MDLEEAKEIKEAILECSRRLDFSITQLTATEDERLALVYKKLAGQIMGLMFTNILRPLYSTFPVLTPEEIRKDPSTPVPCLTAEAITILGQLLSHIQESLQLVNSKVSSQGSSVLAGDNLHEVEESVAHLEVFLRRQGAIH